MSRYARIDRFCGNLATFLSAWRKCDRCRPGAHRFGTCYGTPLPSVDIVVTQEHWAAYYRGGALVSCPTNPEPGYEGRVRDAWEDFFGSLPAGARVLDAGTGNGPVALIAKAVSDANSLDLHINGVDLADIDPIRDVADGALLFAGIDFHGGVSMEALPFADAEFDAVSGQYIVEYTNREATLKELARVLAAGGHVQLILHHADSIVVQNARESLQHAALVERDEQLLEKAGRYFELATSSGAATESARQALIESGKRLEAVAEQSSNPILLDFALQSVTALLTHRARITPADMQKQIERLQHEMDLWRRRLEDLAGAAMAEDDMQAFVRVAEAAGFSLVAYEPLHQAGDVLVGWLFSAQIQ